MIGVRELVARLLFVDALLSLRLSPVLLAGELVD